ncbi:hypothetical protein AC578_1544 [Pseudocercospora eumusae]|uniref:Rieske domain-containing protein n=1 Tax=Pseudocercospora eumusae TaxID=321146 RepID=A0A139HLT1_9PEZI|nr:hypothetical protein AC578_1544 [Pseudocercospora eumusae]
MATSFLPFLGRASNTTTNPWIYAGLASSFPNIEPDTSSSKNHTTIVKPPPDPWDPPPANDELPPPPPCKIFENADSCLKELPLDEVQLSQAPNTQIMIFRYRDKIHAIDHSCPHRTYPLSRGTIYDIEDFGIILSAGITCPKHGWAFDLTTGQSDRGAYKLRVWEVETRQAENGEEQVWVRKKERKRIG